MMMAPKSIIQVLRSNSATNSPKTPTSRSNALAAIEDPDGIFDGNVIGSRR